MTLDQAREIVSACCRHSYYQMGVTDEVPPSLKEYSLRELLDANDLVQRDNKSQDAIAMAALAAGGKGAIRSQMFCADRFIAALYVLYHYRPDGDDTEAVAANGERVVVVCAKQGEEQ